MNSLSARMLTILFVINLVATPALFVGLVEIFEKGMVDSFLDEVRILTRVMADSLEESGPDDVQRIGEMLDSAVLGGRSTYAALETNGTLFSSSLMTDAELQLFKEDFAFGEHGDHTYFLSVPLTSGASMSILRLGFDEGHIEESISQVRWKLFYVLAAYLLATIVLTSALSRRIVRPIRRLKRASNQIATGDYGKTMQVDSDILEVEELARNLEIMRSNLVGINEQLQAEIQEREAAVAEQRVLEDRMRHGQRLESLGTLAGGVAHEFNNVLQPLMLYTDLALEDLPDGTDTAKNLQRVLSLANRARGLSQKILTFGRKHNESNLRVAELTPIVEEAITLIRAVLPASVNLRLDLSADVGLILCDADEIQQLLVNLCNNAIRALKKADDFMAISLREVLVSKELARRYPNLRVGEYAVLEVSDTGIGMDEASVNRAFEPFFTNQRVGEGTGLGLSVVHGIAMRHSGEVVLTSQPGRGTHVRVYLPIVDESYWPHDQLSDDKLSLDPLADDQLADDQLLDEAVAEKQLSNKQLSNKQPSNRQLSHKQ